jgi:hypothetical protein
MYQTLPIATPFDGVSGIQMEWPCGSISRYLKVSTFVEGFAVLVVTSVQHTSFQVTSADAEPLAQVVSSPQAGASIGNP